MVSSTLSNDNLSQDLHHYILNFIINVVGLQKQDRNRPPQLLVLFDWCATICVMHYMWHIIKGEKQNSYLSGTVCGFFYSLKTEIKKKTCYLQQRRILPYAPPTPKHTRKHTPSFPPLHAAYSAAQSSFVVWRCVSAGLGEIMWARTQFKGQCSGAFASLLPHCLPFPTLSLQIDYFINNNKKK